MIPKMRPVQPEDFDEVQLLLSPFPNEEMSEASSMEAG